MDEVVAYAAQRARSRLEAGESVGEIVRALDDELGRMRALQAMMFYRAAEPTLDANETGTSWARDLTLSKLRDRIRAQVAEPQWREYVEIVRDEPAALLLWFKL